ncbi:MAG TPA: hypothetical protein VFD92_04775 [Candidatus Binatia bacterium]|nr:hypothetical protein [Candidatus Binatia bacterium]
MTRAIAVERTANRKTGPVSVTHATQATCPATCPLLKSGCYAEQGVQGIHTSRLNRAAGRADRRELAREEARAIDQLSGKRPLRLRVVGDAATTSAARTLARAVDRYQLRSGAPVWTYTHAWRDVPREAWGATSVLASVESIGDAKRALNRGYAPAIVVSRFGSDRAAVVDGVRVIPCPAQARDDIRCTDCRLCWNADALQARRAAIAFEAHGSGAPKARAAVKRAEG